MKKTALHSFSLRFPYTKILQILLEQDSKLEYYLQKTHQKAVGRLCSCSHKISKNDVFIAIPGTTHDGHLYIKEAIDNGARLLIVQNIPTFLNKDDNDQKISWIKVDNALLSWAFLENSLCNFPSKNLQLLGITGSNGKTSTAWMTYALLRASKVKCCYVGTLGIAYSDKTLITSEYTTPPPNILFPLLQELCNEGYRVVVIEVSSHSLIQYRLGPLKFDALAFTSFSQDHLDFHGSMEAYWNAKLKLFYNHRKKDAPIFIQDRLKTRFQQHQKLQTNTHFYANWTTAQTQRSNQAFSPVSFRFKQHTYKGNIPYKGDYNVENFFAALLLSCFVLKKIPNPTLWENLPQVPGRMEVVANSPKIIIDYAHTPDALDKILKETRKLALPNRLWVVFGAGGERDKSKRPLMTKAALKYADHIILTSDNPRNENPEEILADLLRGVQTETKITKILDRELAIRYCMQSAAKQDVVVIAGKGHEQYQQIGLAKKPFCDHNIVKKYQPFIK